MFLIQGCLSIYSTDKYHPDSNQTLEDVWRLTGQLMYRTAYRLLLNPHAAEDAVMDAVVRIARNMHKFSPLGCNDTRALAVIYVRNTAINLYNKRRSAPYPLDELPILPADDRLLTEELAAARDTADRILALIRRMPPSYRDAMELLCRYDMSVEEIAAVLRIRNGTVRTRLSRGREWLRKNLREIGVDIDV